MIQKINRFLPISTWLIYHAWQLGIYLFFASLLKLSSQFRVDLIDHILQPALTFGIVSLLLNLLMNYLYGFLKSFKNADFRKKFIICIMTALIIPVILAAQGAYWLTDLWLNDNSLSHFFPVIYFLGSLLLSVIIAISLTFKRDSFKNVFN